MPDPSKLTTAAMPLINIPLRTASSEQPASELCLLTRGFAAQQETAFALGRFAVCRIVAQCCPVVVPATGRGVVVGCRGPVTTAFRKPKDGRDAARRGARCRSHNSSTLPESALKVTFLHSRQQAA